MAWKIQFETDFKKQFYKASQTSGQLLWKFIFTSEYTTRAKLEPSWFYLTQGMNQIIKQAASTRQISYGLPEQGALR